MSPITIACRSRQVVCCALFALSLPTNQFSFSSPLYLSFISCSALNGRMSSGDEYFSRRNAKYLGKDGARTNNIRLIEETLFHQVKEECQGTLSSTATFRLEQGSRIIRVDTEKIQRDIQAVKDSSIEYRREYQLYLFIDRETALLSSAMGEPGDNCNSYPEFIPSPDSGVSYLPGESCPASKILIGQVHGHPASQQAGHETSNEMSPADASTARALQVPIYGVDAMYEDPGAPGTIHRANPDGTTADNIGWTRGNYPGAKIFRIDLDALKIWGRSEAPDLSSFSLSRTMQYARGTMASGLSFVLPPGSLPPSPRKYSEHSAGGYDQ
jgi:hypothetical protein